MRFSDRDRAVRRRPIRARLDQRQGRTEGLIAHASGSTDDGFCVIGWGIRRATRTRSSLGGWRPSFEKVRRHPAARRHDVRRPLQLHRRRADRAALRPTFTDVGASVPVFTVRVRRSHAQPVAQSPGLTPPAPSRGRRRPAETRALGPFFGGFGAQLRCRSHTRWRSHVVVGRWSLPPWRGADLARCSRAIRHVAIEKLRRGGGCRAPISSNVTRAAGDRLREA